MSEIRIETLGCRLNQIESEATARFFTDAGFSVGMEGLTSSSPEDKETLVSIINTCTVTQKAEQKARRLIRLMLKKYPEATIIATGCYAQLAAKEIEAIDKSKAKLLYTCNAVCQMGETEDFTCADHVSAINSYLGKRKVEAVIVSDSKIPKDILDKYVSAENKKLVKCDASRLKEMRCKVIKQDLLVIENNYIRHDNLKFATAIFNYLIGVI